MWQSFDPGPCFDTYIELPTLHEGSILRVQNLEFHRLEEIWQNTGRLYFGEEQFLFYEVCRLSWHEDHRQVGSTTRKWLHFLGHEA